MHQLHGGAFAIENIKVDTWCAAFQKLACLLVGPLDTDRFDGSFIISGFFEFISDRYVTALIENHWDGFFLDRIPGVRKAKMRLVTSARAAIGWIDDRHLQEMYLPSFTRQFDNIPYVEISMGLENILKVGRVDVFWRLTHTAPNLPIHDIQNFGIRARYAINF